VTTVGLPSQADALLGLYPLGRRAYACLKPGPTCAPVDRVPVGATKTLGGATQRLVELKGRHVLVSSRSTNVAEKLEKLGLVLGSAPPVQLGATLPDLPGSPHVVAEVARDGTAIVLLLHAKRGARSEAREVRHPAPQACTSTRLATGLATAGPAIIAAPASDGLACPA
jgi:hypothetical protein